MSLGENDVCLLTRLNCASELLASSSHRNAFAFAPLVLVFATSDERMGPKNPRSTLLTLEDEAIILASRWRTRLALDDVHLRLKRLMPNLSRSTLYRCLKRRGLSRIGPTKTCPPLTTAALRGPYIFEIRHP